MAAERWLHMFLTLSARYRCRSVCDISLQDDHLFTKGPAGLWLAEICSIEFEAEQRMSRRDKDAVQVLTESVVRYGLHPPSLADQYRLQRNGGNSVRESMICTNDSGAKIGARVQGSNTDSGESNTDSSDGTPTLPLIAVYNFASVCTLGKGPQQCFLCICRNDNVAKIYRLGQARGTVLPRTLAFSGTSDRLRPFLLFLITELFHRRINFEILDIFYNTLATCKRWRYCDISQETIGDHTGTFIASNRSSMPAAPTSATASTPATASTSATASTPATSSTSATAPTPTLTIPNGTNMVGVKRTTTWHGSNEQNDDDGYVYMRPLKREDDDALYVQMVSSVRTSGGGWVELARDAQAHGRWLRIHGSEHHTLSLHDEVVVSRSAGSGRIKHFWRDGRPFTFGCDILPKNALLDLMDLEKELITQRYNLLPLCDFDIFRQRCFSLLRPHGQPKNEPPRTTDEDPVRRMTREDRYFVDAEGKLSYAKFANFST